MAVGFTFFESFLRAVEELPIDIQAETLMAIAKYGIDGVEVEFLSPVAKSIFAIAKPVMDKSNILRENGMKGGAPKGNKNACKTTKNNLRLNLKTTKNNLRLNSDHEIAVKRDQNRQEREDSLNDNTNVHERVLEEKEKEKENFPPHPLYKEKEKEKEKEKQKEKAPAQPSPSPSLEEVDAVIKEKGYKYVTAEEFIGYYASQGWKRARGQPITSWKQALAGWNARERTKQGDHFEERKQSLIQDDTPYGHFNIWMINNAPYLTGHCDVLLSETQFNQLIHDVGNKRLAKAIKDIEANKRRRETCAVLDTTIRDSILKAQRYYAES